jgi:hypothetical protein
MTAADQPELIAAAAAAIEAGVQQDRAYREAAEAKAGYGMEVRLPSAPGTVGLSYDLAPEPAVTPGNPKAARLVPDYASPAVGGELHHGSPAARTQWPADTSIRVMPSSIQYVPASARQTWRSRLREAWDALLGR